MPNATTRLNSPLPDLPVERSQTPLPGQAARVADPFDQVPMQDGVRIHQGFDPAPVYDPTRTDRLVDPNDPMYYGNQQYQDQGALPPGYYDTRAGETLFANQDKLPWREGMAQAGTATASTVAAGSAPQVTAAQAQADRWNSVDGQVDPNETVEHRLTNLIDKNNDYMLRAKTMGMQYANDRGLLNSSMGAGAAQAAAIDAAHKIASQDAATFFDQSKLNQGFANEAAKSNAELATNVSMKNSELATQARMANAENSANILMKNAELLTQTSIKNAEMRTQANIANSEQAAAITQTYVRELANLDVARMSNETQRMVTVVQDNTRRYETRIQDQEKRWQVSAEIGANYDLAGMKELNQNYRQLVEVKTQMRLAEADSKVKMYGTNVDAATRRAVQQSQADIQHEHDLFLKFNSENEMYSREALAKLDYKQTMDQQAAVIYGSISKTILDGSIQILNNPDLSPEQRAKAIEDLSKLGRTSFNTEDALRLNPIQWPGAASTGGGEEGDDEEGGGTGTGTGGGTRGTGGTGAEDPGGTRGTGGGGTFMDGPDEQGNPVIDIKPGSVVTSPSGKKAMVLEATPITEGPNAGSYLVTTADGGTYLATDPNNPDTYRRARDGFGLSGGQYPGDPYNPSQQGLLNNQIPDWGSYSG